MPGFGLAFACRSIVTLAQMAAILPLSPEVRAQLKSSVQITTLFDAVEELFRNSLDADATAVRIEVDFSKGYCAITDDGRGIPAKEFESGGGLAQAYCTSKCNADDSYGRHGQALAALASLSLLSISSCTKSGAAQTTLLRYSSRLSAGSANSDVARDLGSHGTCIMVHNLFGNLPVRFKAQAVKCIEPGAIDRQFEELKRLLVGYLLARPRPCSVKLSVPNTSLRYHHKVEFSHFIQHSFSTASVYNTLTQAGLVSHSDMHSFRASSAKAGGNAVRIALSAIPAPTKNCQFISLDQWPLPNRGLGALFYGQINDMFEASHFGSVPEVHDAVRARPNARISADHTRASLRGKLGKGVDKWPRFYLRIDVESGRLADEVSLRNEGSGEISSSFKEILSLISALIEHVLKQQQLRPKVRLEDGRHRSDPARREHSHNKSKGCLSHLKRVKSATPVEEEEFLVGLPFSIDKPAAPKRSFDADVQLLLDDIELDESIDADFATFAAATEDESPSQAPNTTWPTKTLDDGGAVWTNHRTGNVLHLNDSSFVVPTAESMLPFQHEQCCRTVLRTGSRPILKNISDLSNMTARLKNWPVRTFQSNTERQIASAVLPDRQIEHLSSTTGLVDQVISTEALSHATVIRQVDEKFILATVRGSLEGGQQLLVLIDQHAADERVKVEELFRQLSTGDTAVLTKPIVFEVEAAEVERLGHVQRHLEAWGIRCERSQLSRRTIRITHLPKLIAERCRQDPKMMISIIRAEIWKEERPGIPAANASWLDRMAKCPAGLIDMMNSRACRSAIMFNDMLTLKQCSELVAQLAQCTLPFQCAHGRPSMTVLTSMDMAGSQLGYGRVSDDFRSAYGRWR